MRSPTYTYCVMQGIPKKWISEILRYNDFVKSLGHLNNSGSPEKDCKVVPRTFLGHPVGAVLIVHSGCYAAPPAWLAPTAQRPLPALSQVRSPFSTTVPNKVPNRELAPGVTVGSFWVFGSPKGPHFFFFRLKNALKGYISLLSVDFKTLDNAVL